MFYNCIISISLISEFYSSFCETYYLFSILSDNVDILDPIIDMSTNSLFSFNES